MENILLILNIILAAFLVVLVLLQKSEGGALGIGVSQDNFIFSILKIKTSASKNK